MPGLLVRMRSAGLLGVSVIVALGTVSAGAEGASWTRAQSAPAISGGTDSTQEVAATLPDGTLVTAWQEKVSSGYAVQLWRRHPGGYGSIDELDTSPTAFTDLQLVADRAGDMIAIWCK